jgi:cytochrome c biogenesis protein
MTKTKNAAWQFLSSVKLALVTLFILAAASIIGTIIKQKQAPAYYVEEYGAGLARLIETLGFDSMYGSWWFIALLALFALNLVVCSSERLPAAWRLVRLDNLATDPAQLDKMGSVHRAESSLPAAAAADRLREILAASGWKKTRQRTLDGAILLFAQQGAWSRLGVYVVHLSILVIMLGAVIGSFFGFRAYVFLPEGRSTKNVFIQGSAEPVPLDFELKCERFTRSFYPNGMIREYRADLTVFDPARPAPLQKSIIVNDPLTYGGISFYQADSYPLEEYFVVIRDQAAGREQAFRVPAQRDVAWPGGSASFRIEELQKDQGGAVRKAKISFAADASAEPAVIWVDDQGTVVIGGAGQTYSITFRQLYSTLLLANRDPGVEVVYLGCMVMVIGLAVSFFLSHRRLWILITPTGRQGSQILASGSSNKLKPAFEGRFRELVMRMEQDEALSPRSRKNLKG